MKRRRDWLLAAGIVAAAAAVATATIALRSGPVERVALPSAPLVTTAAAAPGSGPIPVLGSGAVRPRAEVEVAAEVPGKVSWVNPAFQSGGRVRRGEPLFRVDDADYLNRVRQARASVAAQQVALLQAEEEARVATAEYERFRERRREGAPPAASPLTLREPQLAAARAGLARDSAVLAAAELALSRTEVRAPFGAFVRSESVDAGRFVGVGQAVGSLYADDAYEVVTALPDADAALVPGLWELDAGSEERGVAAQVVARYGPIRYAWPGYVDRAEAALSEQTRTISVVVRVPRPLTPGTPVEGGGALREEPGPPLLVGQFVDVRIEGVAPERYFVLPRRALRPGDHVWALGPGAAVTIVPVRVLQRSEEQVFVTGALQPGQQVVTDGISTATEGMLVRPVADPIAK